MTKTVVELEAAVRRNQHHQAELALIEAELRHRSTPAARALLAGVRHHLERLGPSGRWVLETPDSQAPDKPSADRKRGRPSLSLEEVAERVEKHWSTPSALRVQRGRLARMPGAEASALLAKLDARLADWERRKSSVSNVTPSSTPGLHIRPDPRSGRPPVVAPPPASSRKPKPMTEARRWTEEAVASLRTKLIDLGKRSPLISFKHGGRAAGMLRIVDERPDLLCAAIAKGAVGFEPLPAEDETPKDELTPAFRIAYERARLTNEAFLGQTDKLGDDERDAKAWQQAERALRAEVRRQLGLPALDYGKTLDVAAIARAHGFDPSFDLKASDDEPLAVHHEDDRLRVLLTAKELDTRLKMIAERYGSHKRETGLHTLFMVLGFVEWFEDDDSDVALHAPLLLRDVELARKAVAGRYVSTLTPGEDGLQINVALAEKMRQHWGLELPPLRPEETPESYFVRVEAVLLRGRRLSLRRFATLAVLPFPRMVLWKDLDPAA